MDLGVPAMKYDQTVQESRASYSASKTPFLESNLSLEAKGALSYFLALDNNIRISLSKFQEDCDIGRDKARRIVHELEEAGYIVRKERHDNGNGQFYYDWHITDQPVTESPITENQQPAIVEDLNRSSTSHNSDQITKDKKGKEENIVTNSLFPDLLDQEDQIVNNIINTSITPPYSPPPQEPVPIEQKSKERKYTDRDRFSKQMQDTFCSETGIPSPDLSTAKQRKAAGELWFNPLWSIYKLFRPDEERQGEVKLVYDGDSLDAAVELIRQACRKMQEDKLTISFPKSIYAVAQALFAEGNFTQPESSDSGGEWDMFFEHFDRSKRRDPEPPF